ncbi:hypothetical protein [Leifsonia sp. AG29]|uniref:hypothetical protein n=1 Tax=Leifsonia sp. AG29 TaxID=2598860 RepID=UPI00131B5DB2|nr:hypothetical protein [Leifsonia sp. AG29]
MSQEERASASAPGAPGADPARTRSREARTALPWIGILLLTALFHAIRGAPVDSAIYAAVAAVLCLDLMRRTRRAALDRVGLSGPPGGTRVTVALILVATAAVALAPLYGTIDAAIVLGIGVLLLPLVWAQPALPDRRTRGSVTREPSARAVRRTAVVWSCVIAAGCAWEVAAFFLGRAMPTRQAEFPALSDLLDPLIAWPPARALLVLAWLLGGWALTRRGRGP